MLLDKRLVFIDLEMDSRGELLTFLGQKLVEGGYVTDNFPESVIEREGKFPTGLPTVPHGIAIPHTDTDKVMQSKVAFASLKEPIRFRQMGNIEKEIDVSLVMMLALKTGHEQTSILRKLMEIFQERSMVDQLKQMKKAEHIVELLDSA